MSKSAYLALLICLGMALTGCGRGSSPPVQTAPEEDLPSPEPLPPAVSLPEETPWEEEEPVPGDLIDPLEETRRIAASDPLPDPPQAIPEQTTPLAGDGLIEEEGSALPQPEANREGRLSSAPPAAPMAPSPESDSSSAEAQDAPEQLGRAAAIASFTLTDMEAELLRLINTERQNNGLPSLGMDEAMQFAAQTRAEEALESLSHTRPDGTPYHTAFDEAGFPYAGKWHGENLAMIRVGSGDFNESDIAGALYSQWRSSPGHHQNMLGENFSQTGIGIYLTRDENAIAIGAAQLFASL